MSPETRAQIPPVGQSLSSSHGVPAVAARIASQVVRSSLMPQYVMGGSPERLGRPGRPSRYGGSFARQPSSGRTVRQKYPCISPRKVIGMQAASPWHSLSDAHAWHGARELRRVVVHRLRTESQLLGPQYDSAVSSVHSTQFPSEHSFRPNARHSEAVSHGTHVLVSASQRALSGLVQSPLVAHSTHQPARAPNPLHAVASSKREQSSGTRQPTQVFVVVSHTGAVGSSQSVARSQATHWPRRGPSVAQVVVRSKRTQSEVELHSATHSFSALQRGALAAGQFSSRTHCTQRPPIQRSISQPSQETIASEAMPTSGAFGFAIMPPSGRRQLQPSSDCTVSGGQTQRPRTRSSIRSPHGSAGAVLQPMTSTETRAGRSRFMTAPPSHAPRGAPRTTLRTRTDQRRPQ